LRILLIGYLYGITSERKLVEELRIHLAWRRFTGLGFDQEIPHHSTLSKNRHGRFQESKLFEELFEQIVRQCVEVGLVQGKQLSVDGSFVEANASFRGVATKVCATQKQEESKKASASHLVMNSSKVIPSRPRCWVVFYQHSASASTLISALCKVLHTNGFCGEALQVPFMLNRHRLRCRLFW
jgi:Transposase domain (DUF772)